MMTFAEKCAKYELTDAALRHIVQPMASEMRDAIERHATNPAQVTLALCFVIAEFAQGTDDPLGAWDVIRRTMEELMKEEPL